MNKNPFSIYDFLGYLFPGLLVMLILVFIIFLDTNAPIEDYFSITEFLEMFKKKFDVNWWQSTVIIILLSYISGHVIAYLSSVIVEDFCNSVYKYPSHYLLSSTARQLKTLEKCKNECVGFQKPRFIWKYFRWLGNRCCVLDYFHENKGKARRLWSIIVLVIIFPISSFFLTIGSICGIGRFITRPLDGYIINSIQTKLWELARKLKLHQPDVNSLRDYHRIVMHYVYLNIPNCQRKIDNYVSIYGFLRACTLIVCLFFDYLLIMQFITMVECLFSPSYMVYSINWKAFFILFSLALLCIVLFMGFVKFYRRFTLENYMSLLTEKEKENA